MLSLGRIPLANSLVEPGKVNGDDRYPLDVVRCSGCTLVQITENVPPETLFRTYSYFSSYSETFLEHARRFAASAIADLSLGPESLVVEPASNDGYLLQHFLAAGIGVLGVELERQRERLHPGQIIDGRLLLRGIFHPHSTAQLRGAHD